MKLFKQSFLLVISLVFFASQVHAVNTLNLGNFSKAPKFLSEFGFFQDMQKQIPSEGVHPYSLVNPLFSDQTDKLRFVYVPEGEKLGYVKDKVFIFSGYVCRFCIFNNAKQRGAKTFFPRFR